MAAMTARIHDLPAVRVARLLRCYLTAGAALGMLTAVHAEARDIIGRATLKPFHRDSPIDGTATLASRPPFTEIALHVTGLPTTRPDAVFMVWLAGSQGHKHLAGGLVARPLGEIDATRPMEGGRKVARRNAEHARRVIVSIVSDQRARALESRAGELARQVNRIKGRRLASGTVVPG